MKWIILLRNKANHFDKHGKEFGASSPEEYLDMVRRVIQNGIKVQYPYKGDMRTGFVKYMRTNKKGQSTFAFVGTNAKGQITTLHSKKGKDFWKAINQDAKDKVIRPVE